MPKYNRVSARNVKVGDRVFCAKANRALYVEEIEFPPVPGKIVLRYNKLTFEVYGSKELVLVAV